MDSALLMNQRPPSPLLKETTQSSILSRPEIPLISMTEDQATSYLHLSPISEGPSQKLLIIMESDMNSLVKLDVTGHPPFRIKINGIIFII